MQNLGGKQSVLWAIGKWSIQDSDMQQICKTNKLFVQCHVKGTLTTQLRIQTMEVKI